MPGNHSFPCSAITQKNLSIFFSRYFAMTEIMLGKPLSEPLFSNTSISSSKTWGKVINPASRYILKNKEKKLCEFTTIKESLWSDFRVSGV